MAKSTCSTESDINGNPVSTCDVPPEGDLIEPSDGDINSLLYMYGQDGFGGNNQKCSILIHIMKVSQLQRMVILVTLVILLPLELSRKRLEIMI